MDKPTFKSVIMMSTSINQIKSCARLVLINPTSPDDFGLANEILNNNLSFEEIQELIKK